MITFACLILFTIILIASIIASAKDKRIKEKCEVCDGSGYGYFPCCPSIHGQEDVGEVYARCNVCKESLEKSKCWGCNGGDI